MKKSLSILLILACLFFTSCTTETTKQYDVTQDLSIDSINAVSFTPYQDKELETTTIYVTNTGSKYHEYVCRYLEYSCIEKELQQAINQGYTPCSICINP